MRFPVFILQLKQKSSHIAESTIYSIKGLFYYPVKISEYGCSRYYQVIKNPIDLETIEKKNARSLYRSVEAFNKDMETMFDNCLYYNKVVFRGFSHV